MPTSRSVRPPQPLVCASSVKHDLVVAGDGLDDRLDWAWLEDADRNELVSALQEGDLSSNEVLITLARLASSTTGAPFSQVSLIGDEQAVPVACGFENDPSARTPAEDSLCSVTVAGGEPLAVTSAPSDPLVRDLPPVAEGSVRSYLGAPIFSPAGQPLGAICAFGPEPRDWSATEMEVMVDLATLAAREILASGA